LRFSPLKAQIFSIGRLMQNEEPTTGLIQREDNQSAPREYIFLNEYQKRIIKASGFIAIINICIGLVLVVDNTSSHCLDYCADMDSD
jgi:hypothetical protein